MYDSYNEVFKQGPELHKVLKTLKSAQPKIQAFFRDNQYDEILCVACGSSYWASLSACMTIQEELGVRCTAVKAGEMVMNPDYFKKAYRHPLVIVPSRSGSTTEVVQAVEMLKDTYACKIAALVEYPDSKVESMADLCFTLPWVNEISVCQTRSFCAMYLGMVLLGALAVNDSALVDDLDLYLENFAVHAQEAEETIRFLLKDFADAESLVALGHGKQYGVAVEGAYINIEMAQLAANYFSLLEWRHGPIVLADPHYLVSILSGSQSDRPFEENMAQETQKKGAKVLNISAEGAFDHADYRISLHRPAAKETVALFSVMVLQGHAHLKAIEKGLDPDHPTELLPWISI